LLRAPFAFSASVEDTDGAGSSGSALDAASPSCFTADDGASIALCDFGLAATCNGRSLKKVRKAPLGI